MDRQSHTRFWGLSALLHGIVEDLGKAGWQGFAFLTVLSCMASMAFAQPDSLWSRTYGADIGAWGSSMVQTNDGGFLMAGDAWAAGGRHVYVVRTGPTGDTVWYRGYGDPTSYLYTYSIASLSDGSVLVAAQSDNIRSKIFKISPSGDSLWSRTFGFFLCEKVDVSATDQIIISGTSTISGGGVLMRLQSTGDTIWTRTMTCSSGELMACQWTEDGGIIVSGSCGDMSSPRDLWVVKLDSAGTIGWNRTYGSAANEQWGNVRETSDGGFFVVYVSGIWDSGHEKIGLLRLSSTGDSLWNHIYGGSGIDRSHSLRALPDGGCVIGAHTTSFGSDSGDYWLLRLDAQGDSIWSRIFVASGYNWCNDVIVTNDGGYAMFGGTEDVPIHPFDGFFLLKTGPDPLLAANPPFILHPSSFILSNFPNPFNSSTEITFDLPRSGIVSLKLFDVLGQEVRVVNQGIMPAGSHRLHFDGSDLASGTYLVRLDAGGATQSRKVVLLK